MIKKNLGLTCLVLVQYYLVLVLVIAIMILQNDVPMNCGFFAM